MPSSAARRATASSSALPTPWLRASGWTIRSMTPMSSMQQHVRLAEEAVGVRVGRDPAGPPLARHRAAQVLAVTVDPPPRIVRDVDRRRLR